MAKKTVAPAITYKEIICYAILHLDSEIENYRKKVEGLPDDHPNAKFVDSLVAPLIEKRATLMVLYKVETGVDYN